MALSSLVFEKFQCNLIYTKKEGKPGLYKSTIMRTMSCDHLLVVISVYLCQTEGYESLQGF